MAREPKNTARRWNWRFVLGAVAFSLLTASAALGALRVRRFAITDPQFQLSRDNDAALRLEGLRYASRAQVLRVFAPDFDRSIFSIPLGERRRRLLAMDWVEDASISRIWPDCLLVRIRERTPVAFVFRRAGVLLIDRYGVLLDPPAQAQFSFPVLSGIGEDESEFQRRERVRAFLRVQRDMGYLAKDISEINTADLDDIRVVAQVDHRAIELMLGDENFGRRYQNFLSHYPEIEKRSPEVKLFDLRLDDRITAKE
ncbi:MAG TPA: FtsQ-type POTRA domain-containing protein [Bryobacteraceae bacterium]|nr:FtsQ-type POTRA domain-containing protein [Bryobacteraceae bacterium]